MRPSTRLAGMVAVAVAAVLSGPAWAAQASQAGARRMKFIRFGLCGPPKARNLSAAASLVPVREELFPVWGCPSGWGRRHG